MNYLAHIYLSGDSELLMIGNFIADFIRGKPSAELPKELLQGIAIHRKIDVFTDNHPVTKEACRELMKTQGKYGMVVIDIYYDHFLAKHWDSYCAMPLKDFALKSYNTLNKHKEILPEYVQDFLPYMMKDDWLLNYGTFYGIEQSLEGLASRAKYAHTIPLALDELKRNYAFYEKAFFDFFPEIQDYIRLQLELLHIENTDHQRA